jgi:hypothetical protein
MNPTNWLVMSFYVAVAVMILVHGLALWREERGIERWGVTRGIIRFDPALLAPPTSATRPQTVADVFYEYTVSGRPYRSSRFGFGSLTWRGYRAMVAYLATLCPGSWVTVYYDPAYPQHAVLDRHTNLWDYLPFILTGVGLLAIGPYLFHLS